MTFIEVHVNENGLALEKLIGDAYMSLYQETPPSLRFGRIIVWKERMFQELQFPKGSDECLVSGRRPLSFLTNSQSPDRHRA